MIKALKKIKSLTQIVELREEQLNEYKKVNKELKEKYDLHAQVYLGEVGSEQINYMRDN